jgi:hypothetical protein
MQPTYNSPPAQANPWQLGPTASKIARWVFGLGFFSVHLGIFLIAGLALLMLNLYRSPDDLWVGGPLLRWGIVVVIHGLGAVVTWAITTALDAAEATKRATAPHLPARPAPPLPQPTPAVPRIADPVTQPRARFQPGVSTPVAVTDVGERRFGGRDVSNEPSEPTTHRASPPGWSVVRSAEPAPAPSLHATPTTAPPTWAIPASAKTPVPAVPATPPAVEDDGAALADNRWTWVEAAAEAWLSNRPEKPAGNSDPPKDTPS